MKLLAFDTSSAACSVAIQNNDQIKFLHQHAPMQQAKLILPMIKELLESCSLTLEQLDAIAYGCGPGSFTGIRIANSVAQAIGFAAQKPLIPVSSLAVLAQTALLEHQCSDLLVAVDARMEQVYWAVYEAGQDGHVALINQEILCHPKEVKVPDKKHGCGVGDGWGIYAADLASSLGFKPDSIFASELPTAQALLQLAKIKFDKSQWIAAEQAIPVYLR